MKYFSLFCFLLLFDNIAQAQKTKLKWIPIEQLDSLMEQEPRRILFDVYTDWCGWCKVMDRKTYGNEKVATYLNQNYYAVKINAESKLPFTFNGKKYEYLPDVKMNELAVELLMGQYSYPTTVIMEKNKLSVIPISGYLSPKDIEPILKYFIEGVDKGIGYKEWEKSLKKEW